MENFTVVSKKKSRRRIFNNKKTNFERNRDVLLSNSCPFGGEDFEVLDEQTIDQSIKSIEKTRFNFKPYLALMRGIPPPNEVLIHVSKRHTPI